MAELGFARLQEGVVTLSDAENPIPPTEPVLADRRHRDELAATFVGAAFEAYETRIFGVVLGATRDRELAADVTQEAFLRLLGEARAGRIPDNPAGWLYTVAANLVTSRARRVAVARRFIPRLVAPYAPSTPEEIAIDHEGSDRMRDLLAELPVVDRVALLMAAQGVRGEEIAAHLGKSHAATRTLMSRARKRLRQAAQAREERS
jgi:RNA polymerase sigma-70 factor (ECF subfamily)